MDIPSSQYVGGAIPGYPPRAPFGAMPPLYVSRGNAFLCVQISLCLNKLGYFPFHMLLHEFYHKEKTFDIWDL